MAKTFLGCVAVLCVACGGNVDLGGAAKSSGGGTSAGGSAAGGTSAGGSGGSIPVGGGGSGGAAMGGGAGGVGATSPVLCSTFKRTGDPVKVSNDDESSRPTLVRLGSGATVVYRRPSPGPTPGFELLYPSWTDPWTGVWTKPSPASTAIADSTASYDSIPRATAGALPGSVVVLYGASDNACMTLSRPIPDHTTLAGFPCPPPLFTFGPNPAAVFAGPSSPTGGEKFITAFTTGFGGITPTNYQMNFVAVDLPTGVPPGAIGTQLDALGCATAPLFARGWYSSSAGYLVAFTTSRPFMHCQLDQFADGPPNRVQIVSFGQTGDLTKTPTLVDELVLPFAVLSLELAVRSDGGAWIAFQTAATASTSPVVPGAVQALALDSSGKPTTNAKSIVPQPTGLGPDAPASYAVTALGNRLVLAGSWENSECDGSFCPGLSFHIVDESSAENAPSNYVSTPPSAVFGAPVSLLASADGSRLLAAYSDFTDNPTDVWAERYECLP